MATARRFTQLDVFTAQPLRGNPLAVVHDAQGLSDAEMAAFARWTNLSETTFLLPPADASADYQVRIFTPGGELPFAGHPTLGVEEDPVTGSLNASLAQWLIGEGLAPDTYVAAQGTAMGRAGRVHVRRDGGTIWVGGDVATCISGSVVL